MHHAKSAAFFFDSHKYTWVWTDMLSLKPLNLRIQLHHTIV